MHNKCIHLLDTYINGTSTDARAGSGSFRSYHVSCVSRAMNADIMEARYHATPHARSLDSEVEIKNNEGCGSACCNLHACAAHETLHSCNVRVRCSYVNALLSELRVLHISKSRLFGTRNTATEARTGQTGHVVGIVPY